MEICFNEDLLRIKVSSQKAFQGLKEEYKRKKYTNVKLAMKKKEEEDIILLQTDH